MRPDATIVPNSSVLTALDPATGKTIGAVLVTPEKPHSDGQRFRLQSAPGHSVPCGYSLSGARRDRRDRVGELFGFCGVECAETFDRLARMPTGTNPLTMAMHPLTQSAAKTARDPLYGMTIDTATETLMSVHDGIHDFCSPGCQESFDTEPARYGPMTHGF